MDKRCHNLMDRTSKFYVAMGKLRPIIMRDTKYSLPLPLLAVIFLI